MEALLNTLVMGRIVERIAVVVIAGLAIVLGWELMRRRLTSGDAEIQHGGIKVTLRRVGPGVIFALCGAIVLGYATTHPVTVEITEDRSFRDLVDKAVQRQTQGEVALVTESRKVNISQAMGSVNDAQVRKKVAALNKVLRLAASNRNDAHVLRATVDEVVRDMKELENLRNEMVIGKIGGDNFALWQKNNRIFKEDAGRLPQNERERLTEIAPWFDVE